MVNPPIQAVVMVLAGLVFMLVSWLLSVTGISSPGRLFPWSVAASFLLFFAVMNSLLSIQSGNFAKYWGSSMYSFMGLALVSGLLARLFSGIPFAEAGTYRWIFFVVTFCFLVFLSMINFIKRIVTFAEREEWNQPRRRNR